MADDQNRDNHKFAQGMSSEEQKIGNEIASEPTTNERDTQTKDTSQSEDGHSDALQEMGNESSGVGARTTLLQEAPFTHPTNLGEQDAAGGTTSAPETDDDTLAMAKRAGFQTDETTEDPKPLDAGRDIDKAEKAVRES